MGDITLPTSNNLLDIRKFYPKPPNPPTPIQKKLSLQYYASIGHKPSGNIASYANIGHKPRGNSESLFRIKKTFPFDITLPTSNNLLDIRKFYPKPPNPPTPIQKKLSLQYYASIGHKPSGNIASYANIGHKPR